MAGVFDIEEMAWQPARPDVARGVFTRTLLAEGVRMVLARVVPGGCFIPHSDPYDHLFYFLSGKGAVRVGGKEYAARPGLVVRVTAGETHAYTNTGEEDLILVSLNLPSP